jgi:pimeloyl-ACP methyl ester carboxylesterase
MKSLVFVHGYFGGGSQWADQVALFSEHYNVITPDLPGFGKQHEMAAPESIRDFATYILDGLDKQGFDHFHLVGHSMGGMIVQEMTALAPERIDKLVLYGTGPVGIMPGRFETIEESRRGVADTGVEATGRRIAATWFRQGTEADGYPICVDIAMQASEQAALAGLTAMEGWSGVSSLSKIAKPTLVLWGDGDRAYLWNQPEQLWRGITDAQLAVIPGCSHAVHLEKPGLFNAMLQDFLDATSVRDGPSRQQD